MYLQALSNTRYLDLVVFQLSSAPGTVIYLLIHSFMYYHYRNNDEYKTFTTCKNSWKKQKPWLHWSITPSIKTSI